MEIDWELIGDIRKRLDQLGMKQTQLAKLLNHKDHTKLNKQLNGKQEISSVDLKKIDDIIGLTSQEPTEMIRKGLIPAPAKEGEIVVVGVIAKGRWDDLNANSQILRPVIPGVIDEKWPIEDQAGYILDAVPAIPSKFQQGATIITVDYSKYRTRPLAGDDLIRKVTREDGLVSYQLLLCASGELVNVLTGKPADNEGELIGLVIESRNRHQ